MVFSIEKMPSYPGRYISLKNYGRNQKKRKEDINQSGLLLAEVDVSKTKHDACIGTQE